MIKGIIILCLVNMGYNIGNPISVQTLDVKASYCVDRAVECSKQADTVKCVHQAVKETKERF